jgi:UTP--glucose-1-phosphate uridylyltransferase
MASLMTQEPLHGLRFDGQRHDIGNKLDFIKANIHFGLLRDDIAPALRSYLKILVAAG